MFSHRRKNNLKSEMKGCVEGAYTRNKFIFDLH